MFPGNRTHNLCAANAMLYHWATGTIWYSLGGLAYRVPIGLKNVQIIHFGDDATMTRLSKWQVCQLSRNESKGLEQLVWRRDALMWSRFEREKVKERRRGPAESLMLVSLCGFIYSHNLPAILNVCRNFSHYNLESCGDKLCDIHTTHHGILDMINYNSITEICEIKLHYF